VQQKVYRRNGKGETVV